MKRGFWLHRFWTQWRAAQLAITFLSVIPLPDPGNVGAQEFRRASAYYPLVGYLVGGAAALVLWLPLPLPANVQAALAVWAWLAVTGLMHFDGLVDSADALLAPRSPERRLEIMHDVHVGAFGLATGVLALLLLWSLLGAGLPAYAAVVAAVLGRAVMWGVMNAFPVAGSSRLGGQSRGGAGWVPLLLTVPVLLLPGGWQAALAAGAGGWLAARFAAGRLGGGLSGDIYGLVVVAAELGALGAYAWGRA
ncbi:adenosylcobinamide-GDP ribazoletransferase [Deinococcus sp. HMF7604]|uniref:adenosylcobinamide-GDP ribazoletransferase n=1 Tax=Deinococcus betulae TaxID=2873312 RepID=UPI001CCFEF35|nr:adenosylcobinamide-GDP ribazoletransferase [Deinococcus betulae]